MLVIDASALVAYLGRGAQADEIEARITVDADALCAPHLIDAEVGHALTRGARMSEIGAARARHALADLQDLRLRRVGHVVLLDRAWQLRDNLSFYEALYVALAERLGAPLLTLDARLAGAPGVKAQIDVLS
jgi:predicted nucleic acid-binding protein